MLIFFAGCTLLRMYPVRLGSHFPSASHKTGRVNSSLKSTFHPSIIDDPEGASRQPELQGNQLGEMCKVPPSDGPKLPPLDIFKM